MSKIIVTLLLVSGFNASVLADVAVSPKLFQPQNQKFLHPDDAFKVHLVASEKGQLEIKLQIAQGYYLYKSKILLKTKNFDYSVTDLNLPTGEMKNDPTFGEVEIYPFDINIITNYPPESDGRLESLIISYQGCADGGICYPPQEKTIDFPLGHDGFLSETGGILERIKGQNGVVLLMIFFGFGVVLSLTPCVLPMLPILSGILVGETGRNHKSSQIKLSISYVLGMASTYSLLGLFMSLVGYRLQVAFQNPWIICGFALMFFIFGAAMFGQFSISVPAVVSRRLENLSRRQKAGTYPGVYFMGMLAALIVGPCVAPPLAAALTLVSQTGSMIVGATCLFAMGLGMGVPLIALGASASFILPKAGAWMRQINELFGLVFFGVGIWFLGRLVPSAVLTSLWSILGALFIYWVGIRSGIYRKLKSPDNRLIQVISCFAVVATLCLGIIYSMQFDQASTYNEESVRSGELETHYELVTDLDDLAEKLSKIKNNKLAMLELYADWCIECVRLEKNVLSDPKVLHMLSDIALFRLDLTKNSSSNQAFLAEFGLFGPPALLFFSNGQENTRARVIGYAEKEKIYQAIDYTRKKM